MSFIDEISNNLSATPGLEFLKISSLIRKRIIVSELEKTAEVSQKLVDQDQEILSRFFKAAYDLSPSDGRSLSEADVANSFALGGDQLLKVSSINGNEQYDAREVLHKLASTGVVNSRLQEALQTQNLTKEAYEHVRGLGRENNGHMISLLTDLVKVGGGIFGSLGEIGTSIGNTLRSAGGSASGKAMGATFKNIASGGGDAAKNIAQGARAVQSGAK